MHEPTTNFLLSNLKHSTDSSGVASNLGPTLQEEFQHQKQLPASIDLINHNILCVSVLSRSPKSAKWKCSRWPRNYFNGWDNNKESQGKSKGKLESKTQEKNLWSFGNVALKKAGSVISDELSHNIYRTIAANLEKLSK